MKPHTKATITYCAWLGGLIIGTVFVSRALHWAVSDFNIYFFLLASILYFLILVYYAVQPNP